MRNQYVIFWVKMATILGAFSIKAQALDWIVLPKLANAMWQPTGD